MAQTTANISVTGSLMLITGKNVCGYDDGVTGSPELGRKNIAEVF